MAESSVFTRAKPLGRCLGLFAANYRFKAMRICTDRARNKKQRLLRIIFTEMRISVKMCGIFNRENPQGLIAGLIVMNEKYGALETGGIWSYLVSNRGDRIVRRSHCEWWQVWSALPVFVCPSHIGRSRCPVWISFNVNLLSLSIRIQLNVRATRAELPCLFLCALPEWTSTGYGSIGGLIWIIRQRRRRYLCSRCI